MSPLSYHCVQSLVQQPYRIRLCRSSLSLCYTARPFLYEYPKIRVSRIQYIATPAAKLSKSKSVSTVPQVRKTSSRVTTNTTMSSSTQEPNIHFAMPAESARHLYTLMAFPSIESAEDKDHLAKLQSEVVQIANTIAQFEPVHLYARKELMNQAQTLASSNVSVKEAVANELWIRDSGPVFVKSKADDRLTAVSFNFNYWGNKLPFVGDEDLARKVAEAETVPLIQSQLTLEGGAIEHDGEGTFLGAESCILNDNRNPSVTKRDAEAELTATLGVTHFIWVPGLKGYDITDYHIDALARFIKPGTILLSKPHPNAGPLPTKAYQQARDAISKSKDAQGRTPTIYDCEEPDTTQIGQPGDEFNEVVATYANYLLVNGAVIMPMFGQEESDNAALNLFSRLFPDRRIVQVPINMLPRTGGGIHCATQQVPA